MELYKATEFLVIIQSESMRELTKNAGITIPEEGYDIYEIEQQYLAAENIAIMVKYTISALSITARIHYLVGRYLPL